MKVKFHDRFINIAEEKTRKCYFRFDNCFICSVEKRGMGLVGVLNKVKILIFHTVCLLSIETCVQLNNVMLGPCSAITPLC